jgi:peptidoglycan/xylan/chitin deacetylase (PgdA/CDA1 family)
MFFRRQININRFGKKYGMSFAKKFARGVVFPLAVNIGADKLIKAVSNHNILNVFYHGISRTNGLTYSPINMTGEMFEKQLIYFKKNFDVITLKAGFELKKSGIKPKRKTITVSFDDGYKNNLEVALPLLEKHQIPATFFICSVVTQSDGPDYLWTDLLNCLKYFFPGETIELDGNIFEAYHSKALGISLGDYIKSIPSMQRRDETLDILNKKYKLSEKLKEIPAEYWKLMSNEDIKKFSRSKFVEIGSHSHLHYNLGVIPPNEAKGELEKSKLLLENSIQKEINMIAYPDGSYTSEVKNISEKLGYKYQMAVDYRCAEDPADPRILGRYGVSTTTTYESAIINTNRAIGKYGYN